jgi:hypothetical protein
MIVATFFDEKSWDTNWLRKAKSVNLSGFIIGKDLPEEAELKIKELGFQLIPLISKYNNILDRHYVLAQNLAKGQSCLFVDPSVELFEKEYKTDVACQVDDKMDLLQIVMPVANLHKRAEAFNLIRDKIQNKYNALLSPKCIFGTYDFWNGFFGFQSYMVSKNYIDRHDTCQEFFLNLYLATIDNVSLEILNN